MDALKLPDQIASSRYVVSYQQKNITNDLSAYLTRISYTDHLTGQSDELEVELEDVDGRWRGPWYPGKGDTLSLEIGWEGEPLVPCGDFVIDEIEFSGAPSTAIIRALATGIDTAVRTTQNIAYEKTTLDGIARRVAKRQGLTLVGKIEPIPLERVTQTETDVAFLTKLAGDYDYAFKIVGHQLVFSSIAELAHAGPAGRVKFSDLQPGWRIRDQIKEVPAAVQIKSHNPGTGKLVTYEVRNGETVAATPSSVKKATSSSDTLKKTDRTGTTAEARVKAQADLARANREQTQGSFAVQGRPRLMAGRVLALDEAANLSGDYLILTAVHNLNRSGGFETRLDVCRVRDEPRAKAALAQKPSQAGKTGLVVYGMTDHQAVRTKVA